MTFFVVLFWQYYISLINLRIVLMNSLFLTWNFKRVQNGQDSNLLSHTQFLSGYACYQILLPPFCTQ